MNIDLNKKICFFVIISQIIGKNPFDFFKNMYSQNVDTFIKSYDIVIFVFDSKL